MDKDETLSTWIDTYGQRLARLAYTYIRDWSTAEDCTQNAFIKAYRAMGQLKDINNPFPWLARIVLNECNMVRRKGWREVVSAFLPEGSSPSAESEYVLVETEQEIYGVILSLPESYRLPLVLFYFEGLAIEEIAKVLKKSPGAIRTRLTRGRNLLRNRLGVHGNGEVPPASETLS